MPPQGEVNDALGKIEDVAMLDDCSPPFFNGVFAYRGPVKEETVTNYILDYYRKDSFISVKGDQTAGHDAQVEEEHCFQLKTD